MNTGIGKTHYTRFQTAFLYTYQFLLAVHPLRCKTAEKKPSV